jgi:hypothetical protein
MLHIGLANPDLDRDSWFTGKIRTGKQTLDLEYIQHVDIHRDFNSSFMDDMSISLMMPLGDYQKHILPNKKTLEITLKHDTLGDRSSDTYKFIITDVDNAVDGGNFNTIDQENMNKQGFISIKGQCLDVMASSVKAVTVSGVYQNTNVESVIGTLIYNGLNSIGISKGSGRASVFIVTPNNTRTYKHIIVPTGTSMLELPNYIQKKYYGVYNGDIGTYIKTYNKETTFYVYPLYRNNLLNTKRKKLIIVAVPPAMMLGIDNTYTEDKNGDIRILVPLNAIIDDDEADHITHGVSVTTVEPETLYKRAVTISMDKIEHKSESIRRSFKHDVSLDVPSPVKAVHATSNNYEARSSVLRNDVASILLEWRRSNARLIEPGMPVLYLTESNTSTIEKREGIVQGVDIHTNNATKSETTSIHVTVTKKSLDNRSNNTHILNKIF